MPKLTDIQGIGQVYAARLSKAGIQTLTKLIEQTSTPQRLGRLAKRSGISEQKLLIWAAKAKRGMQSGRASFNEPTGPGGGRPRGSLG